jgi:hypothetical protein
LTQSVRNTVRAEMETNRVTFHALLNNFSEADLSRPSANPAFSVKAILHHMTHSLQAVPLEARAAQRGHNLLAMPQGLYDILIVPGTRFTAWFQNKASLARNYDAAHTQALKALDAVQDAEWTRPLQMFYVKTTLEDVFRRQARHIAEHAEQLRVVHVSP